MASTILITGANRGIGLELVRQYAADNWRIFACCRYPEKAKDLELLAETHKDRISIHELDVSQAGDITRLAKDLAQEKIDILFNNAGVSGPQPQGFGSIDSEAWLYALRINTLAPFHMAVAFADQVAASNRRIFAIMGTQLGSMTDNTSGGIYVYRSSKAAVHMVGKSLSVDLEPRGIITLLLHPGWVRTSMGGPDATLSAEESVRGLRRVLEQVKPSDNGKLISYNGRVLPW